MGRADGGRQRRAAGDRVRRPAERRQVIAVQLAAGRVADDRVRDAGDDPRRHRHDDPVGSLRDRAHRHGGHPAARQGRQRARRGALLDAPCAQGDLACRRRGARPRRRRRPHRPGRPCRRLRDRGGPRASSSPSTSGTSSRKDHQARSTSSWPRSGANCRSSTTRRSCRSARRPASACRRCWSSRSTCGASAAGASPPGELNRLVAPAVERQPPPLVRGRRPKIRYATQVGRRAADVRVLLDRPAVGPLLVPPLPREPAARRVRFAGTPIRLVFREQVREKRPRGRGRAGARRH